MTLFDRAGFELVQPKCSRGTFRAAIFDFDGTLSLFREGWVDLMVELALEKLSNPDAREMLRTLVLSLNGRPTIIQMQRISELVRKQIPQSTLNAQDLYGEYLARLMKVVTARREKVISRSESAADWVVPNTHALLLNLQSRGLKLYAASGTDLSHVRYEAELLGLKAFFEPHIYGPDEQHPNFSKGDVVARILQEQGITGDQLVGFGDGVAETLEVKAVGGTAIGIASVAKGESGRAEWKRAPLVEAGADLIIPHYREQETLIQWLFCEL